MVSFALTGRIKENSTKLFLHTTVSHIRNQGNFIQSSVVSNYTKLRTPFEGGGEGEEEEEEKETEEEEGR